MTRKKNLFEGKQKKLSETKKAPVPGEAEPA
jgi:hypothetical protein